MTTSHSLSSLEGEELWTEWSKKEDDSGREDWTELNAVVLKYSFLVLYITEQSGAKSTECPSGQGAGLIINSRPPHPSVKGVLRNNPAQTSCGKTSCRKSRVKRLYYCRQDDAVPGCRLALFFYLFFLAYHACLFAVVLFSCCCLCCIFSLCFLHSIKIPARLFVLLCKSIEIRIREVLLWLTENPFIPTRNAVRTSTETQHK